MGAEGGATTAAGGYRGRFAPSPTGALHAGSVVAALGSWLDARAHGGQWLLRIEDVDHPRCVSGAEVQIIEQLQALGLQADGPPWRQSARDVTYARALQALIDEGLAYPCACSRSDIEAALRDQATARGDATATVPRHQERVYPGTCRAGLGGRAARAWRLDVGAVLRARGLDATTRWFDRRLGWQQQDVAQAVGDFVLRRADGLWAYQLAVVVDDAAQGISDVVRGEDLADNTARQIVLQAALRLPTPRYLHLPLVRAPDGHKLSKQNGARAVDTRDPLAVLTQAALALGLPAAEAGASSALTEALKAWTVQWSRLWSAPSSALPEDSASSTIELSPMATDSSPPPLRKIRTFVRRAGRTTVGQEKALQTLGERFVLPFTGAPIDAPAAFGRRAPLVLEIGFGMGDATARIAQARPGDDFLCCEVHEPGVGALLKRIGEEHITNIRILQHDAVEVIEQMLPVWDAARPEWPGLAAVHIFFPDPWHKTRHHKRRLIQPPLVAQLAQRLHPGGLIHCATDWEPYAQQMLQVLSAEPLLHNTADAAHGGYADKPDYRPETKFERRGLRLGHGVWDLVFRRRAA